jgi:hypothetical protein
VALILCHHRSMSFNEKTANHTRRILKDLALTTSEIAGRLNHEVSAVDAYNISQIEGMLKQMPDVEEIDGKYRLNIARHRLRMHRI